VDSDSFYSSYEWIQSLELAHGESPIFVVRNNKELMGVIPTWKQPSSGDKLFSLTNIVGDLPGVWDKQYLWLGGHRITANSLLCIKGKQREHVVKELMNATQIYAAKQHLAGVVYPFLSLKDASEIAKYCPAARVIIHSADPVLHVPSNGFRAFIKSAKHNDRKKWLKEIERFQNSGAIMEWKYLDEETMELATRLIAANRNKYGSSGGREWMNRTFSAQIKSGVAKKAVLAISRIGSQVKAIAIFYQHHDWLYGRYWGAEKDTPPYAYYVLTQYASVEWASQHGLHHIHLSISAWESKVRRGAKLYPLAMVILPKQGESEWISESVAFQHNMSVVEYWKNRFSSRLEAFDNSWNDLLRHKIK
jgi:predicted N-acyltransferase